MDNRIKIEITTSWRPSKTYYEVVGISGIEEWFADYCLAEFILNFLNQERTQAQWESSLMRWTKKEFFRYQAEESHREEINKSVAKKYNKPQSIGTFDRLTDRSWAEGME